MVSIKDKLSVFQKIVQDEVKEEYREKREKLKAHYAKEDALLHAEKEQQSRLAADQAAFERQRLAREARAKKQLAERQLQRRVEQEHMNELLQASREEVLARWNADPAAYCAMVEKQLSADDAPEINRIEGPESWADVAKKSWPNAEYQTKPLDGLILYGDEDRLRYDFTLSTRMKTVLPKLAACYRKAMDGGCTENREGGRQDATHRN